MIETGKILQQRYRIDKQIGQGGMGSVYIATDERFGSVVAIKETLLMDDSYRKAIEREARLLNSLKHPALPRVSDHFLEDNGQFLVMEYIPGEDLGCMMDRDHHPFAISDVLNWADQLLDALDYLHNQSIPVIHRDIKPQNLKLTPRGQIILLDFGLAKGNPTDAGHHTAAKSIFGYSKNYASLEQIQGTGTDPRSDIYSLAATLYHLLAGVPPEDALTRAMNVLSNKPDPLVPAHRIREEIPKGVSAILYHSMDLNAEARPASAREMREMFRSHEDFANWESTAVAAAVPVPADLHSQRTQLLNQATYQEKNNLTDVQTAVLPANRSQETVFRSNAGQNANRQRRRTSIVAVVAAAAIACGAAAGAYFYDPSLFGAQAEPVKVSEPAVTAEPSAEPTPAADSDIVDVNANSVTPPSVVSANKVADTGRSSSKPAAVDPQKQKSDAAVADDQTVYVGNMKIRNGVVETPDVYIDENGIRRKVPKVGLPNIRNIPEVPLTPEQLRMMTPAQRRRLQRALEQRQLMLERQRIQPPAVPSPEKP
jgi:serine/threonine protein kinase